MRLDAFYRSLAHLESAGIPWPRAVATASGGDPDLAPAVAALHAGRSLSEALHGFVPPLDLAGIRAAEVSGRLETTLLDLSRRAEETLRRDRERRAAAAYPMAVAHVAALLMPVPDLVAGRTLAALGWAALVLVPLWGYRAYRAAVRRAWRRLPPGTRPPTWTRWSFSRADVEEADARALRAFGWLHDAGVPHLEALPLAAHAGAGGRVAEDLADAYGAAQAGRPLHTAWRRTPADTAGALATGETTGRLAEAAAHEAASLDGAALLRRQRFAARARVVVLLVLGLVVGARVLLFYWDYFARVSGRL